MFYVHLNAQTDWFFAVISRKYKKCAIFDILMTAIFAFQDLQNSAP